MAAAGHHPAALRPHTFGPGSHVPSAQGCGRPTAPAHCPRVAGPGAGTAICSSLRQLLCSPHAGAGSGSHVLRPFPLAEAPNEIKDLLRRGGGKGTG